MDAPSPELLKEEEYKVWKKNTPFLYDTIASFELEWPSLTVSWFPDKTTPEGKNYSVHRLLMGTHTSGGEMNHLIVSQIKLPLENLKLEEKHYNEESAEYGGFGVAGSVGKYEILQRINHPGEVNRARPMPQNPDIIATKTNSTELLVFDRTKHPSQPPKDGSIRPEMRLQGHKEEGYGLSWNPFSEGKILSCADDGLICQWDIKGPKTEAAKPIRTYAEHKAIVEDVAWHQKNEFYFASASDDHTVKMWDSRQKESSTTISGHRSEVNAVAFSRHSEFFLLSGSKDKTVGLWDLRNPSVRLHILEGHEDSIFRVEWAPFDEALVASCGADDRVILWDLRRIGCEQAPEDAADGAPEMVFVHGGHTDKVSDMGWNEHEKWTMASVGDNNVLQCWTVSEEIYNDDINVNEEDLE